MQDMKLSIVIPVYNVEKYIRKTLNSIFFQQTSYDEFEVIIVNDGTPDNSMAIVEEFSRKYPNIIIVNQNNAGLSSARNHGIIEAHGKYIWFVDSDDWVDEMALTNVLDCIQIYESDVFVFGIKEYDERVGAFVENRRLLNSTEPCSTDIMRFLKNRIEITPVQMYVIRRDFILNCHLFFVEGILHEDMEYAPRLLLLANSVMSMPYYAYCYLRRTSGSITSSSSNTKERLKSLMKIANIQADFEHTLTEKKKNRMFSRIQMWLIINIMNYVRETRYDIGNDVIGINIFLLSMRKIVAKNLFYKFSISRFICRCIFLLRPEILCRMRKGI